MKITVEQLRLLRELADCQGCVDVDEYDSQQDKEMRKLEAAGFVQCAYLLTSVGKREIKILADA